ncbi:MAG: glycosyltransferase family 4 protein [Paludibacteraceae bacterium]|nr:glycosyltransferase family 4 protein [Paludibacteraceae bacterium]
MNILHVINISFVLRHFIGDQFFYFPKKGYTFHVACSPSDDLPELAQYYGFSYLPTPVERKISIRKDFQSIRAICRYIRKNQIDIVVGHSPKGAMIAMIAAFLCRVPKRIYFRHGLVYETSHGFKRTMLKWIDRVTSFCATKVVCVSPSLMQQSLKDHLCPAYKQVLLGNGTCGGIDTLKKYNPANIDSHKLAALREQYGIDEKDFVIGYTGRLVRDKGIIELIDAFDRLPEELHAKLLLVGMFEERDALPPTIQERIKKDKRIVFPGLVNTDMEYYYAIMNIYVLASYREGFPIGALEAQSMKVPVLTTHATGCRDAIIDGQTGLFISHDPDDIARQIIEIRRYPHMGTQAREWVVSHFDHLVIWKYIEDLYRSEA